LGEVFVVRTAGQSLDDNAIGSIEYALEHLGAALIIVMGHTSCGAVKAAHSTLDGSSLGTTSLDALVRDMHPRLQSFKTKKASTDYEDESWANVRGVSADLVSRSKLIAEKLADNKIMIVPAMYHLNSGEVKFADQFRRSKVK
jgi:carbonic anhydrase